MSSWIAWAVSGFGLGIAGVGALALFVPGIGAAIKTAFAFLEQLAPLLGAVVKGIVEAWNIAWVAVVDIMDTWQTQVFFAVLCTAIYFYAEPPSWLAHAVPSCKPAIERHMTELRKDYTFVRKAR